ncbi:MAG TPA: 6-phosphogluconolactonase, partial [Acidimicrobiales bacterium]
MNLSPTTDVPGAFVDAVRDAFAGRAGDRFTLVLSGGPTAWTCYERLAEADGIDWPAVDVYVGDERFVPADDADANQRLIREALLDRVGGAGSFTPMPTEPGGPDDCAAAYQEVVAGLLAGPGIDLI